MRLRLMVWSGGRLNRGGESSSFDFFTKTAPTARARNHENPGYELRQLDSQV